MKTLENIELSRLERSAFNPRASFPKAALEELAESIKEVGILQPLIVRPIRDGEAYEIVDGARRFEAAKLAGLTRVPCLSELVDDRYADTSRIIANLQREDLHPLEEAKAFKAFMEVHHLTIEALAERLGKTQSYIAESLNLLQLGDAGREHFENGTLTVDHARLLAKLTPEDQGKALEWLVDDKTTQSSRYSEGDEDVLVAKDVKIFRSWIDAEINLKLLYAPWNKADSSLVESAGACLTCVKNSGANQALFPELGTDDTCTDRTCFRMKLDAYRRRMQKATRKAEKKDFLLLSEASYLGPDDPLKVDGVKGVGRYKVITEKNACEFARKGQFIDGERRGEMVLVCNYSKCPKHWGGSASGAPKNSPAKAPRNVAELLRQRNNESYTTTVDLQVGKENLRWILAPKNRDAVRPHLLKTMVQHLAGQVWNIETEDVEAAGYETAKKLHQAANKMKVGDLFDALAILSYLSIDYDREGIQADLVKDLKIDTKAIRKGIEKDLHRCETCRCSEITACMNWKGVSCSWQKDTLKVGRYVCTNCAAPAVTAAPAKKGGKA